VVSRAGAKREPLERAAPSFLSSLGAIAPSAAVLGRSITEKRAS
jgi:hypothetical protein